RHPAPESCRRRPRGRDLPRARPATSAGGRLVIARLRGRAGGRVGQTLVVDVNGVGYLVHATPSVQRLGDGEITVEIHTVVREDALQLFGFATADERGLFELLLGVSGVGPKVALAILSGSTPAELRRAIARDDVKRFQAIP